MKATIYQTLFCVAFTLTTVALFSQITVHDYDRQPEAEVHLTDHVEAPLATSKCGRVSVEVSDKIFSGGCLGTLARTYTYSDECGNTEQAEQYIRLRDYTPPVFVNVPESLVAQADSLPPATEVSATDNSDKPVTINFREEKSKDGLVRIWEATDRCGNKATATQVISYPKL